MCWWLLALQVVSFAPVSQEAIVGVGRVPKSHATIFTQVKFLDTQSCLSAPNGSIGMKVCSTVEGVAGWAVKSDGSLSSETSPDHCLFVLIGNASRGSDSVWTKLWTTVPLPVFSAALLPCEVNQTTSYSEESNVLIPNLIIWEMDNISDPNIGMLLAVSRGVPECLIPAGSQGDFHLVNCSVPAPNILWQWLEQPFPPSSLPPDMKNVDGVELVVVVAFFGGLLGLFGALVLIVTFVLFPNLRSTARRFILYISICDVGQGIFFTTVALQHLSHEACLGHTIFGYLTAAPGFLWTTCLAFYVNWVVTRPTQPFPRWALITMHVICWSYSVGFCILWVYVNQPIQYLDAHPNLPEADWGNSWTCMKETSRWLNNILYEAPLIFALASTTVFYLSARHSLSTRLVTTGVSPVVAMELVDLRRRIILVPLAFIFLRVWNLISDVHVWHTNTASPAWLRVMYTLGGALQGFVNMCIFIMFNSSARGQIAEGLRNALRRCCRCGRRSECCEDGEARPIFVSTNRASTATHNAMYQSLAGPSAGLPLAAPPAGLPTWPFSPSSS